MLRSKCQIEGCKPYPATKSIKVKLHSGLVGRVKVCDMHHAMNKAKVGDNG